MKFLTSIDLWANIVGGVVTAILLALFAFCMGLRKHKILHKLIEIMGEAIQHRNIGEHRTFTDEKVWVDQAKELEEKAITTAKKLSSTAGSLLEWLDRVPAYDNHNDVEKYVSLLSTVIQRIQLLMKKNA